MTTASSKNLAPAPVEVSVVVPTLNEASNLPELLRRIDAALAGRAYEVIVVDDSSTDDTPAVCAELEKQYPLRLRVRAEPHGGLAGAVLEGFSLARGDVLVTLDGDLQHPPEKIPEILAALRGAPGGSAPADFALGSRYAAGGSTAEKWGPVRRLNSWIATVLARPFAGRTSDPMSGFFAIRRETFERAQRLLPLGYKVGLELMCKCRVRDVREVPIHFDARAHGQSKLTLAQQFKYLEHLSRLYDFCYPRASPIVKFLVVTGLGWFVGLAAFMTAARLSDRPTLAVPLAYLATIATTAVFHLRYVRTQRQFLLTRHPWRDFLITASAEFIVATLTGLWLVRRVQMLYAWELFLISWGCATVARYVLRKELMQDIRGLRKEVRSEGE